MLFGPINKIWIKGVICLFIASLFIFTDDLVIRKYGYDSTIYEIYNLISFIPWVFFIYYIVRFNIGLICNKK